MRITQLKDPGHAAKKEEEYDCLKRLRILSPLIPRTFVSGRSDDGLRSFAVLEYLAGDDGESALENLDAAGQYLAGITAGLELRRLHALQAPPVPHGWFESSCRGYAAQAALMKEPGEGSPGIDGELISEYIRRALPDLPQFPRTFLHGDYHPGNLIFRHGTLAGIADFERCGWGDPIRDLSKAAFYPHVTFKAFCTGQIDGYTGGSPSPQFWKRYALNCALAMIDDICDIQKNRDRVIPPDEIALSRKRTGMIYADHEGFLSDIPRWYQDCAGIRDAAAWQKPGR